MNYIIIFLMVVAPIFSMEIEKSKKKTELKEQISKLTAFNSKITEKLDSKKKELGIKIYHIAKLKEKNTSLKQSNVILEELYQASKKLNNRYSELTQRLEEFIALSEKKNITSENHGQLKEYNEHIETDKETELVPNENQVIPPQSNRFGETTLYVIGSLTLGAIVGYATHSSLKKRSTSSCVLFRFYKALIALINP